MGLIDKLKRTFVTPLVEEKEEGMAMVRSLRETGTAALAHAEALAALLKLELKEASNRLGTIIPSFPFQETNVLA